MKLSEVCSSYFHGFHEISSITSNDAKTNALAILKIVSYVTLIFPIIFGLLYVASCLYGRFNQNEQLQIAVDTLIFEALIRDIEGESSEGAA